MKYNRILLIFGLALFIIVLSSILSCKQADEEILDIDKDLFDKINTKTIHSLRLYDSIHDFSYKNALLIQNLSEKIISSIKENSLSIDSIKVFNEKLYEYCKTNDFKIEENSIDEYKKNLIIYKIRAHASLAIQKIYSNYHSTLFTMETVKVIAIPRKNKLIIGEQFVADIYLSGKNYTNKIVIFNDLNEKNETGIYSEVASKKGEIKVNSKVEIFHPGMNQVILFPFETSYTVE